MPKLAILLVLAAAGAAAAQMDSAALENLLASERITTELTSKPLENAVHFIIGHCSEAVRVRWGDDLEQQGARISQKVENQPIGDVLREMLRSQGLDYVIAAGEIQIIRAKEKRCAELEAMARRFADKGITVEMVVPNAERCQSRTKVAIGKDLGATLSEGDPVDGDTTVGLIHGRGVVFIYQGTCFAVGVDGGTGYEAPPAEVSELADDFGDGSDPDQEAFEALGIKVTGIYQNDDPRARFALVNSEEVFMGDELSGRFANVLVKEIYNNHVVFQYRGHAYPVYMGD